MSKLKQSWEVVKCPCGDPGCRTYQLKGVGTFYQGCGFEKKDAYLLAAAPDLLRACEFAISNLESPFIEDDSELLWSAVAELKDAIAKAKGE